MLSSKVVEKLNLIPSVVLILMFLFYTISFCKNNFGRGGVHVQEVAKEVLVMHKNEPVYFILVAC